MWYPATEASTEGAPERVIGHGAPAWRDAIPEHGQGPYPLVIFSHGSGGMRVQSTFYTVHLASLGYVVAAMDHKGNTFTNESAGIAQSAIDRPLDVAFVTAELLTGAEGGDPLLSGLLDPEKIGITGHSFGAWTSLATLHEGHPFSVSVPVAIPGTEMPSPGHRDDLGIPVLLVTGTRDKATPYPGAEGIYDILGAPRSLIGVENAGHGSFTDYCGLLADERLSEDGCGPDFMAPEEAQRLLLRVAGPFFDLHLAGDARAADTISEEALLEAEGEQLHFRSDP